MIRILIVEDDFRIADIHVGFLKEVKNIEIVGKALSGKEALHIATKKELDLVLLDLYIPDIPGVELIKQLRIINPNIDFIIISAATEVDMVRKIVKKGIFDYIIKPVKKERFIQSINNYKVRRQQFEKVENVNQTLLDKYFGYSSGHGFLPKKTPKGIDPLTLEKVKEIMCTVKNGITAEEMGEKIGASRTTARRYLEYLISKDEITADLEYGTIGRPERRYYISSKNGR